MAKKFKDYYNKECAEILAEKISKEYSSFDSKKFIAQIDKAVQGKEFSDRQDIFAKALEESLPEKYEDALKIFKKILGPELQTTEGMFTHGWWLWPVGRFVERNAVKNPEQSMTFIYELTKRFTGEFAIRPLTEQDPKKTLKIIEKWSKDKNVHVRRLASEGMRPKLPWAKKMTAAIDEFNVYKKVLTNLKGDKEKFVQKSVGNNVNDLMKIDPVKANKIINDWRADSPSKETLWIIKHGTRSLRKKAKKK